MLQVVENSVVNVDKDKENQVVKMIVEKIIDKTIVKAVKSPEIDVIFPGRVFVKPSKDNVVESSKTFILKTVILEQ